MRYRDKTCARHQRAADAELVLEAGEKILRRAA